jgi:hypothetical protein
MRGLCTLGYLPQFIGRCRWQHNFSTSTSYEGKLNSQVKQTKTMTPPTPKMPSWTLANSEPGSQDDYRATSSKKRR